MLFGREKITLFLGNFGSGKTEVAVNFALHCAHHRVGEKAALVDLDLVNPYFRSRESREVLESRGVRVVLPDRQYLNADLPILVPEVRGLLKLVLADVPEEEGREIPVSHVILDVGGDDVGARVLGALSDALPEGAYRACMVLNANRPMTRDVAGIRRILGEIETAGAMKVTGFVSNTHLMEETNLETIIEGRKLAAEARDATGLPLQFVCVPAGLVDEARNAVPEEILPIYRFLTPPWVGARPDGQPLGKELFEL